MYRGDAVESVFYFFSYSRFLLLFAYHLNCHRAVLVSQVKKSGDLLIQKWKKTDILYNLWLFYWIFHLKFLEEFVLRGCWAFDILENHKYNCNRKVFLWVWLWVDIKFVWIVSDNFLFFTDNLTQWELVDDQQYIILKYW